MTERFDLGRDVLRARGPEAGSYLQGQLSQDVAGLGPGEAAWSWLLAPTGKVEALLRVTRIGAEEWLLDTDGGWGEPVAQRLLRFRLRTRIDVEPTGLHVLRTAGRPPGGAGGSGTGGAGGSGTGGDGGGSGAATGGHGRAGERGPAAVLHPAWPGLDAFDTVGPPDPAAGGAEDYEPYRILAAIPRMGCELDERTIPAEAGLTDWTVSFTKGCYTGQELVARVDSRGNNVPRRLAALRGGGPLHPGDELLTDEGTPAGTVTSAAADPAGDGWVALGWVRRSAGDAARLRVGDLEVVRVEPPR